MPFTAEESTEIVVRPFGATAVAVLVLAKDNLGNTAVALKEVGVPVAPR